MTSDKEIASIKMPAGKRTYFIDVKETREGAKYLKISESKRLKDGSYERHQVMFFEEHINDLMDAMQAVVQYFPTYREPEVKSKMAQTKEQFENAYKPWTAAEDLQLTQWFCEGKKANELSALFKRNVGAINSRIERLELKLKYGIVPS